MLKFWLDYFSTKDGQFCRKFAALLRQIQNVCRFAAATEKCSKTTSIICNKYRCYTKFLPIPMPDGIMDIYLQVQTSAMENI